MSDFVVDCESDGEYPDGYSMVCFGAVLVSDTKKTFYGKTKPISNQWNPEALKVSGFTREEHEKFDDPKIVMENFCKWVNEINGDNRPTFWSDNLAYDWQWINYYCHKYSGKNPFGFSGRRIGDLYCGFVGNLGANIELTEDQKDRLKSINPIYNGQKISSTNRSFQFLQLRNKYQEEGRIKAKENDPLHLSCCMLYWAEGAKKNNRNCVAFSNSDINMLKMFIQFLKTIFNVNSDKIALSINCYNDFHTVEEIEKYWLNSLGLSYISLKKTMVNKISSHSLQKRKGFCEYGTCKIAVHDTQIIQHIYGAIQEYGQFENKDWIM